MTDIGAQSEAYLERVFQATGIELGPKPERVSEAYADERIEEKIATFPEEKQRAGLWSVNRLLQERQVPPSVRLHLMTAVTHLSRISGETLADRHARSYLSGP